MDWTLLQWNINGFRAQFEYLQMLLYEHQPNMLCVQETNFRDDNVASLRNYSVYFKNRTNQTHASGGVATYVKNSFPHRKLNIKTTLEAVAISIILPISICICNIYIPNSLDFDLEIFADLVNQLPKPFILLADFNSYNTLWGSVNTNQRGRIIESLLDTFDLTILNSNQPTHYCNAHNTFSNIDLSISTPDITLLLDWSVYSELYGSDHFPIIINRSKTATFPTVPISNISLNKWRMDKANWQQFKVCMEKTLKELTVPEDFINKPINDIIKDFTDSILRSAETSIPKTSTRSSKRKVPWWNEACKLAIQNKNRAYYRFKRKQTIDNKINFQQCRAAARKEIKQSKIKCWLSFVSSLTNQTPQKVIWDKIKKISGVYRPFYISFLRKSQDAPIITNHQDIVNELAETFANISNDNKYSNDVLNIKTQYEEIYNNDAFTDSNDQFNCNLQMSELIQALQQCNRSSPGPDSIPYEMLKQLPPQCLQYLLDIYNYIWTGKIFQDLWHNAIVIPIPKHDKDISLPENFRPITLTCTMCKLMEKIINKRLQWILESKQFFSNVQSGFRQSHSTLDHLITLESEIWNAFVCKYQLTSVSLDIEKAYDTVWHNYIIKVLIENHIRGNMLNFIYNFLQKRIIQVRANGRLSEKYTLINGVPQGSIISVTLFLVAINGIVSKISPPVKACLFADDLTILCSGRIINTTRDILQNEINIIQEWMKFTGLTFSKNKSKCITFTRNRRLTTEPELYLGNYRIENVNTITVLGLVFDKRLSWVPQIKSLKDSCLRRINVLKMLAAKNWGADFQVLINTYKASIRSKLDYGSIIYNSASPTILKLLDIIQNSALRIALGAFRTSPITSILIETNEPPLAIRRKQLSLTYAFKIASMPNSRMYPYVFSMDHNDKFAQIKTESIPFHLRITKYLNELNQTKSPVFKKEIISSKPPWKNNVIKTNTELSKHHKELTNNSIYKQLFNELRSNYSHYTEIYTDGSKTENGSGCAVVYPEYTMMYSLPKCYTIFSSELYAIKQALLYVEQDKCKQHFIIFTDSMSAIIALNSASSKHTIIQDILTIYNKITDSGKEILIIWIPSHCNIAGNEKADLAAREATRHPDHLETPIPHLDIISYLKEKICTEWKNNWIATSHSKLHCIRSQSISQFPINHLPRKDQVIITRLRIGHCKMTHSYLLLKQQPPQCDKCNCIISVKHVITECRHYQRQRQENNIPSELQLILNNPSFVNLVIKFIKDSQLYNEI